MDLIKVINEFSNVGVVVILQVLIYIYIGVKASQEIYKWFLGIFNAYSDKRSQDQKDEKTLESVPQDRERFNNEINKLIKSQQENAAVIEQLKDADETLKEQLNQIVDGLKNLSTQIKESREEAKTSNIATARAQLLNLADKAKHEGSITLADLETFDELQKIYIGLGGNSHFKHSIIPKYFQYPVRDLQGMIALEVIKSIHDKDLYSEG